MAGRGGVPQSVVDTGRHRAEVALPGEHLAEGVGHVNHRNVGGVNSGRRECISHYFGRQIRVVTALAGEVAREVALITAEDPDVGYPWRNGTTTKRVTGTDPQEAAPPAPV